MEKEDSVGTTGALEATVFNGMSSEEYDDGMEEIEVDMGEAPLDDDDEDVDGLYDESEDIEKQFDHVGNLNGKNADNAAAMQAIVEEDLSKCIFDGHSDSVYCVSIHPLQPGIVITGGGDDKAFIWSFIADPADESADITSKIELAGHTDTVTCVGFNHDGTMALTGSYDGTIRLWKTENGEHLKTLDGPEDIEWACWHNKGNAIIGGSQDGTIWMWMAHNGACVHVLVGHDGLVTSGSFTSDGKSIVSSGEDGTVRVWGPKAGICKHTFDVSGGGHEATVTCMAPSDNDANLLATGSVDGTVKVFHLTNKRVVNTFTHYTDSKPSADVDEDMEMEEEESVLGVECVGFAGPAFSWVASGGLDNTLKIWDRSTNAMRCACTHPAPVVALKWHTTKPLIVTSCVDNNARLWDARNGNLIFNLTGHTGPVTSIDMKPLPVEGNNDDDIEYLATVSDDNTCRIWQIKFDI